MKTASYLGQLVALFLLGWSSIVVTGSVKSGLFWASVMTFSPAIFLAFWVHATHGFKRAPLVVDWAIDRLRPASTVISWSCLVTIGAVALLTRGWEPVCLVMSGSLSFAYVIAYVGLFADYGRE